MNVKKLKFIQAGNTLIELLIASAVISLVLTGVAISMMYSLKREALNRYKQTAVDLANESLEFLNFERASLGWGNFIARYGPAAGDEQASYCFNQTDDAPVEATSGVCSFLVPDQVIEYAGIAFLRDVKTKFLVSDTGITKMQVEVTMSWRPDEQDVRVYQLTHEFSQQDY